MNSLSATLVEQSKSPNSDIPAFVSSDTSKEQSNEPENNLEKQKISSLQNKASKGLSQKKRITYACIRCRRRHIKCPGGNPCEKCDKANAQCEYPEVDKKLVISKKYLQKLQEEIASLKKANASLRSIKTQNPTSDSSNNKYGVSQNSANEKVSYNDSNPNKKVFKPIKIGSSDDRNSISFLINNNSVSSSSFSRSNSTPSITQPDFGNPNRILRSYDTAQDKNLTTAEDKKNSSITLHDDSHISEVIPPFVESRKRLVSSNSGEKFYAGSSSMTLFGLEVESMIPNSKLPTGITTASASTTFIPCDIDSESAILPDDEDNDDDDRDESANVSASKLKDQNNNITEKPLFKNKFEITNDFPKDLTGFSTIGQLSSSSTKRKRSNTNSSTILEREGNTYRIYLRRTESRPGISVKFSLPAYSYAMLLIDTFITYNDGCFYFFNEGLVKESLKKTYNNSMKRKSVTSSASSSSSTSSKAQEVEERRDSILETINFCKFLLIFAIGEMYLGTANNSDGTRLIISGLNQNTTGDSDKINSVDGTNPRLPGSGFFQQASELFTGLFSSGAIDNVSREGGIEVTLLYAFYLQVADCSAASYLYFGIALRASFVLGLHVDVEKDSITRFELEHRRRLFWTVYMFERMLSSKAGLPLSLSDDSISTELPQDFESSNPPKGCEHYIFPDADYITNCVTIVQINAVILSSLYQRAPTANILPVIVELITRLFQWKESLPHFLKPDFQKTGEDFKITRLVTNIMTEYFQGINLAVRPLLFYLTTKQIKENKTSSLFLDLSKFSQTIITLLNASFQGSINTIRSLWHLMPQNMVALFGYMDREYLFTSAATLILFNATFGVHGATKNHLDHALMIFTKMKNLGNNPAELRRAQLIKLMQTFNFNSSFDELLSKFVKSKKENKKSAKKPLKKRKMSGSCSSTKPNFTTEDNSNSKAVRSPSDVNLNPSNDIKQDSTLFDCESTSKNSLSEMNPNTLSKKVLNKEIRKRVNVNRFKYQRLLNQNSQTFGNDNFKNSAQEFVSSESLSKPLSNAQNNVGNKEESNQNFPKNLNSMYMLGKTFEDRSIQNINEIIHGNLQHQVNHPISNTRSEVGNIASNTIDNSDNLIHQHSTTKKEELINSPPAPPIDMEHYIENYQNPNGACDFNDQDSSANNNVLESFMSGDFVQPDQTTDFINRINTYGMSSVENKLWDDITNQQAWLNDISEEFMNLMENIK